MHKRLQADSQELDRILSTVQQYAARHMAGIADVPAARKPPAPAFASLPQEGAGLGAALDAFRTRWAPGFSGSAGPRYLGFVTGGATPASVAGDWLTSVFDQNPTSGMDSSAPDLERETVAWLRQMFGLSASHTGTFVTGATMSNTVGLAIAREWLGEQAGIVVSEEGMQRLPTVKVLSGAPHSSIYKGLSMLGIGRSAVRNIALLPGREAVDMAAIEQALAAAGGPVIVVANAGTVNTVDFDDLSAIVALKSKYPFWLHVDAAFGGFAALTAEHAHLVAALDAADSVCIDCHKWLNVPYDSALQFTRRRDLQLRVFQNNAAYLGMPSGEPDMVHLTPENSRRLRALAAWFSLSAYGRDGHRDIVERNVAAARKLGELIVDEPRLRLLAPVRMNVVCFSLAGEVSEKDVQALIVRLRDEGEVFLTPTVLHGTWGIRAAFSNWRTQEDDVTRVFAAIGRALPSVGA